MTCFGGVCCKICRDLHVPSIQLACCSLMEEFHVVVRLSRTCNAEHHPFVLAHKDTKFMIRT